MDLERQILDPASPKGKGGKKYDIIAACRNQLRNEKAWPLYFEHQRSLQRKTLAKKDDDDKDDKEDEAA